MFNSPVASLFKRSKRSKQPSLNSYKITWNLRVLEKCLQNIQSNKNRGLFIRIDLCFLCFTFEDGWTEKLWEYLASPPSNSYTSGNVKGTGLNVSLKREDYQYHFAIIEDPFSQGLSNGSSLAIHPRWQYPFQVVLRADRPYSRVSWQTVHL